MEHINKYNETINKKIEENNKWDTYNGTVYSIIAFHPENHIIYDDDDPKLFSCYGSSKWINVNGVTELISPHEYKENECSPQPNRYNESIQKTPHPNKLPDRTKKIIIDLLNVCDAPLEIPVTNSVNSNNFHYKLQFIKYMIQYDPHRKKNFISEIRKNKQFADMLDTQRWNSCGKVLKTFDDFFKYYSYMIPNYDLCRQLCLFFKKQIEIHGKFKHYRNNKYGHCMRNR